MPSRERISSVRPHCLAAVLRLSTLFLRTLRDDPADAEVPSHKLLVRAGYVRRVAPGIYSWLPLGMAVLANVERIVREEMNAIGSQEVHFPALIPRGDLRGERPVGRLRRHAVPAARPQGRRLPARARRTRSCSRCWSRASTRPTRTIRSRCTRSRRSTATRRGRAPASCAAASSS